MIADEIADLFASFSQPDEFHVQAQLELFAWARNRDQREQDAKRKWMQCPKRKADLVGYQRSHHERRKQSPEWRAKQRERNRMWMANKRAEQRAA
jgi:hypothetical protein